jgi:hypothetical protein
VPTVVTIPPELGAAQKTIDEFEVRAGSLDPLAWHSELERIWGLHGVDALLMMAQTVALRMRRSQLAQNPGQPLPANLPPRTFDHLAGRSEAQVVEDCTTICGWFWRASGYDRSVLDRLADAGPRTLYALAETAGLLGQSLVDHATFLADLGDLVRDEQRHRAAVRAREVPLPPFAEE